MEGETVWRWIGTVIVLLIIILIGYATVVGLTQKPLSQAAGSLASSTTPLTQNDAAASEPGMLAGTPARSGRAPVAKTTGFASVSSTTAVVVGTVIPESAETTYWFEYGPTLNFGLAVDARSAGAGSKELGAAGYLTGLKPGTEYYFRIGAQNAYGRTYGGPYKLMTASR